MPTFLTLGYQLQITILLQGAVRNARDICGSGISTCIDIGMGRGGLGVAATVTGSICGCIVSDMLRNCDI